MKFSLILVTALTVWSANSFASGTLLTFTGQPSPLQHLTCDSQEINILVASQGNSTQVTVENQPGNYTCSGVISNLGADMNCVLTNVNQEAPKKFELHAGADRKAKFAFSGSNGFSQGSCNF